MFFCLAVTCLFALATSSKADGTLGSLIYAPEHSSVDYYAYPSYAFEYAVKDPHTGDNKAQWEKRDGDTVKGAYSLVEPDGSLRVVEYWADAKSGFNAVVKRVGPNLHPVAAPVYKAPIPVLSQAFVAPINVGSVAKIEVLGSAPAASGAVYGGGAYGGAVSSAALYKAPPIVKSVAPIAPFLPVPAFRAPILPKSFIPEPYIKAPIGSPIIVEPFIKELELPANVKTSLLESPGLPWPLWKDSSYLPPLSTLGDGLLKDSLLSGYGADLRYNPNLSLWNSYGLGLKH